MIAWKPVALKFILRGMHIASSTPSWIDTMEITLISVLLGLAYVVGDARPIINVLDYGAVGDGKQDDTQSFLRAWGVVCLDFGLPKLLIPLGKTFLLSQIAFEGPCNSNIHVQGLRYCLLGLWAANVTYPSKKDILVEPEKFLKAWGVACLDFRLPTLLVPPEKIFLLSQIAFEGLCNSSIHVQASGNIVAPYKLWTSEFTTWVSFRNVNNLTIDGSGQIDGQGSIWWDCKLSSEAQPIINVLDHGAVGDGKQDDTQFRKGLGCCLLGFWIPTLLIPPGKTFLLSQIAFEGPCKSGIHVQVSGNIVAPNTLWTSEFSTWILFRNVNDLTIDGSGQIDGQGSIWWDCKIKQAFGISACNNAYMDGIKFINSPGKHLTIHGSSWVHIKGLSITAPAESPNTDGMYIQASEHVEVRDTIIGTGDDCIAIGTGSSDVNITGISCGPGHGISIGSLGGDNSMATVEGVHVSYSNFYQTTNGVRIKTWQGGSGFARGISFEHINLTSVQNPILIDQFYCITRNCQNSTSAVKLSDVRYADVHGTSATDVAINLACSETVPCSGIVLESVRIVLDQAAKGNQPTSYCLNAQGSKVGEVTPDVPCLK
ncbi:probable polygalacturonase At2g43860 [Elaeis guineensis]|uniref:probable polygalacturonase At2g43860 n=1 Tax=Elaeis guineensis var. tenera TaxID=51953 RepID=UPI003C6D3040